MTKKIYSFILMLAFLLPLGVQAQKHSFEIKGGQFVHDGKPVRIISGEMHYPRIPHQYWRHRMQMLKAMGLNAVATYVFWNAHEPAPGQWDFTGDRNLAEYIRIAGEEGLMVILRPGPYVCAEWEFGGYPWWLQNVQGLELRRDNEQFLKYTRLYLNRLYQEVGKLQITKGGPIIMVQAENEFGSYVAQRKDIPLEEHRAYNAKIVQQLKEAGFDVPSFTSDGSWLFEGGATPGALPTANGEGNIENLKKVVNEYHHGEGPYMVAEFYPGWLDHWAEPFPLVSAERIARQTEKYLQNDVSINYYMVHGGTNFGFTTGANYDKNHDIQPDMTSYDYDAPISEAGWATPKYDSIRNVVRQYITRPLPEVPAAIPVIEIPPIRLTKVADMLEVIGAQNPIQSDQPMTFEQMNQGHGYVLYKRHFTQPVSGKLEIEGLRDYAIIYVNGEKAGELNRYFKRYDMEIDIPFNSTLEILVENMGRINYGAQIIHNTKGIISPVKINGNSVENGWEMYPAPMDKAPVLTAHTYNPDSAKPLKGKPVAYQGNFTLTETGDTFLDMEDWGKGIVFVNGKNIGRYWKVGPQHTLYVPGVWLKKGDNEIVIFEQQNDRIQTEIKTTKIPVLTKLKVSDQVSENPAKKKIPLGGNSYVTVRGASGSVTDTGFQAWSDTRTVFSAYFKVNREGDLGLSLEYSADTDGNVIEVSCRNQTFTLALPKPQTHQDTIVYIGAIAPCKPGYVKVDFRGKTLKGRTFAAPSALLASGKAAENMNFVGDFSYYWGRRGPSVHLNYPIPDGITAEWFYNEVTVPTGQDPVGSYFMANGFGEGYFGIQVNSKTERRILFSVWSPYETDNPKDIPQEQKVKMVKKGKDVKTGEFGNEGSGGQSYLIYNWKAGNTYKFLTRVRPSENSYTEYTAYFYAPETGKWKLIAQFLRPSTTQYYTRPHSFLENFSTHTGYIGRKAYYNNQWIYTKEGEWIELTKARFTADDTAHKSARMDYKGGIDESGFFLQNCGFFDEHVAINSVFDKTPTHNRPDIPWKELE